MPFDCGITRFIGHKVYSLTVADLRTRGGVRVHGVKGSGLQVLEFMIRGEIRY